MFVQTKPDLWDKVERERLDPATHVEAFREGNVLTIWVFWEFEFSAWASVMIVSSKNVPGSVFRASVIFLSVLTDEREDVLEVPRSNLYKCFRQSFPCPFFAPGVAQNQQGRPRS